MAEEPTNPIALIRESVKQRIDRFLVAVDDVEHAGRQSRFQQQFGKPHRHRGIALRGLENEGVAAGERRREFPHRDHGRKVERRDAGDDAERLAHGKQVDARAGALGEFALEEVRNAAGELDDFEAALHVALGVGEGLAVLGREKPGETVEFTLRQFEKLHEHACAPLRIDGCPGRLRGLGDGDRMLDLGTFGEGDARLHLTGIGIKHVAETSRCPFHLGAADEMADLAHGSFSLKPNGVAGRLRMAIVPLFSGTVTGVAARRWQRQCVVGQARARFRGKNFCYPAKTVMGSTCEGARSLSSVWGER